MSRSIEDIHASEREFHDRKMAKALADRELLLDENMKKRGEKLLRHIGMEDDLKDKKLLETGSGVGKLSSFLALRGADVKAFDISPKSVAHTNRCAKLNGIKDHVDACAAAFEAMPYEDNSFDLVVGTYILHHLPDLDAALVELRRVMKPGAQAFFVETSSLNPVLRFFRDRIVGHFWIPKMGTDDEYPLTQADIEMIEQRFPENSEVSFPKFHFFELFYEYIFRAKLPIAWLFQGLDRLIYLGAPFLRKYSYTMVVRVSKGEITEQA